MKITHPFSPMYGKEYILIERRCDGGEDVVYIDDEDGRTRRFLTSWTDYFPQKTYSDTADADFRFRDLADLNELLLMIKGNLSM